MFDGSGLAFYDHALYTLDELELRMIKISLDGSQREKACSICGIPEDEIDEGDGKLGYSSDWIIHKDITLFTAELLIFLPVIISTFATVRNRYGITGLSASIKSLPFTTDFPFDINIQNAIILAYTLEFLILYCIMSGITLLFGRMKNVMAAVLCSMAVFVLPAALWLMGFAQAEVLTILDELAVCGWLF